MSTESSSGHAAHCSSALRLPLTQMEGTSFAARSFAWRLLLRDWRVRVGSSRRGVRWMRDRALTALLHIDRKETHA